MYWDGTCDTCDFPLKQRFQAGKKYCDYPCQDSEYLNDDGACASSCNLPLAKVTRNAKKFCEYPCSPKWFLYWDGSCSIGCPNYLNGRNVKDDGYCDFPCQDNEFRYTVEKKCDTVCDPRFNTRSIGGKMLCERNCNPNELLYWNGSCKADCPPPFEKKISEKRCNNKCSGVYKFMKWWSGECTDTCDFPLKQIPIDDDAYCEFPCKPEQFLFFNGTCASKCPKPYKQDEDGIDGRPDTSRSFCDIPCAEGDYYFPNGTCINICPAPWVSSKLDDVVLTCNPPCPTKPNIYYDLDASQCRPNCQKPRKSDTRDYGKTCQLLIDQKDAEQIAGIVQQTELAPQPQLLRLQSSTLLLPQIRLPSQAHLSPNCSNTQDTSSVPNTAVISYSNLLQ